MKKRFRHKTRALLTIFLLLTVILSPVSGVPYAYGDNSSYARDDLLSYAKGIVAWRNQVAGLPSDADVIKNVLTAQAATTSSDWFVIAMSKLGLPGNYDAYLSSLTEQVKQRYLSEGQLSGSKATEWHRISLAFLACGGNPASVGGTINLIADGTYNRGLVKPLNAQGNNGIVFALIALDAKNYDVPGDAFESRMDILQSLLACQLADGGFAQWGSSSDVDVTAMALTALAPYKGSYSNQIGRAVSFLSSKQSASGGFSSGGVENAESTAQVIIALTSLGINPQTDSRFVKNGHSAANNLISYIKQSGGVSHTPGGTENEMAGQQALCALAALVGQMDGQSSIYRFASGTPSLQQGDMAGENPSDKTQEPTVESPPAANGTDAVDGEAEGASEAADSKITESKQEEIQGKDTGGTEMSYAPFMIPLILFSMAALCLFFAFKYAKGRKKDLLIVSGFLLALAALYFLANPQRPDQHYQESGKENVIGSASITIDCSAVYDHWEALDEALQSGEYLPKDGVILQESSYPIEEGDTAFDLLLYAASKNKIQIDYQGGDANLYDTVYVRGIQYLYEFSCGPLSGWTYAVNGDFPDVGCSSYLLSDGDSIEWLYTCDLGRDVGNIFQGESN